MEKVKETIRNKIIDFFDKHNIEYDNAKIDYKNIL